MKVEKRGQPLDKASKALILLHGRGGNAVDMLRLADHFCDETFYIVAPQAENNSWYPYSFMVDDKLNEPWLSASVKTIKQLIDDTAIAIPTSNIYLMGFSQGACLSLEVSARFATSYGGVVAFTGGLIGKELNPSKYHGNFKKTKAFIGTSDNDPHVPLERSQGSKQLLETLGAQVTLKVYPGMSHTVTKEEIEWVQQNLF